MRKQEKNSFEVLSTKVDTVIPEVDKSLRNTGNLRSAPVTMNGVV